MWMLAVALSLLVSGVAYAQQDTEAVQRRLRAFDSVTMQRNQAMDSVAVCIGEFSAQVETLKKQLEDAKKACEKPKE